MITPEQVAQVLGRATLAAVMASLSVAAIILVITWLAYRIKRDMAVWTYDADGLRALTISFAIVGAVAATFGGMITWRGMDGRTTERHRQLAGILNDRTLEVHVSPSQEWVELRRPIVVTSRVGPRVVRDTQVDVQTIPAAAAARLLTIVDSLRARTSVAPSSATPASAP